MLLRIALLLMISCYSVNAAVIFCPPGWTEFEYYCYRYFLFKKSWYQAHSFCNTVASRGYSSSASYYRRSDLTSISNSREQAFLHNYWQSANAGEQAMWIGLNDPRRNRVFQWSDGTSLLYQNWKSGEPNNDGNRGEYYGTMLRNGKWNDDHSSSGKMLGFTCKMRRPGPRNC